MIYVRLASFIGNSYRDFNLEKMKEGIYNSIAEDLARVKEPDSEVVSIVIPESMGEDRFNMLSSVLGCNNMLGHIKSTFRVLDCIVEKDWNEDLNKTKVIADFFNNIIIPIFAYSEKDTKFVNMENNSYMTSFEYVDSRRMEINKQERIKVENDEPFTDEELRRIFVGSGVSIEDLKQPTASSNSVTKMSLFDK